MKTAKDAAKYLADQALIVAAVAAKMDNTDPGSVMQKAMILRSEIMMDCARMIRKWDH